MSPGPADDYLRDMVGYWPTPPDPRWPGEANIAVQFVVNYEEGAESSVLHGDPAWETFLSGIVGAQPFPNRHMGMESLYELSAARLAPPRWNASWTRATPRQGVDRPPRRHRRHWAEHVPPA